ncbi:DUF2889 domain-containing protein [Jatrophihabitans sp.]|uniref:DUF2889 domain-containing protein n=1 Tax=Jatrophihabitans sp. TaxID=1932789 RepID=UPI0030C78265
MRRDEGPTGPLLLLGRGRDLKTTPTGAVGHEQFAAFEALVDFYGGRQISQLETAPERPALRSVVGARAGSGFRAAFTAADPSLLAEDSLLYLLLDDLPVATLVSGQAVNAALSISGARPPGHRSEYPVNVCAGFTPEGTILTEVRAAGRAPVVTGPVAPSLASDDPLAWHSIEVLPRHAMRRARRIDVWRNADESVSVDVLFRDSYRRVDDIETVIHEYSVTAEIAPDLSAFTACAATGNTLPWVECSAAPASAGNLQGVPLDELRERIRETWTGPLTCTHLNDTLRSLADVPALLDILIDGQPDIPRTSQGA